TQTTFPGMSIDFNTRSTPTATLPAGSFLRVNVTIAASSPLTVGTLGKLSGSFLFQQQTVGGSTVTLFAMTGAQAFIGTSSSTPTLDAGEGAFILNGSGIAGYLSGKS